MDERPKGKGRRRLDRFKVEIPPPEILEERLRVFSGKDLYFNPDSLPSISSQDFFGNEKPLALDLGCGRGELVVSLAQEQPGKNFIGIDMHRKSLVDAVSRSVKAGVDNVRFLKADLRLGLRRVPDESVEEIYIMFPPPVVERKHIKKDFLTSDFVREVRRILSPKGSFHLATDHKGFFEKKVEMLDSMGLFRRGPITKGLEGGLTWYQKIWESHGLETLRTQYFKEQMPKLSIIIPCKDDFKVIGCVDSVDFPCEIVIVFNGSTPGFIRNVKNRLQDREVVYLELRQANLSKALEEGIWVARNEWVLLMDSDCQFKKGTLQKFYDLMKREDPSKEVYKGKVIFSHDGWMSKVIAKSRQHHTAEVLTAYKPPLSFSKEIADKAGGYFFNEKLIWREDADLDNRLRGAGIKIVGVPGAIIYHGVLNLKTDLRSTFRYGIGGAIADHLRIKLTDVPRSFSSTLRSQGVISALYMIFRNRFYTAGYFYQKIKYLLSGFW